MVKHVIIWSFKEGLSDAEKQTAAAKIKTDIEGLMGQIEGLVDIKLHNCPLPPSSGDLLLDSTFVDEDALKAYQINPIHVAVATYVKSMVGARQSFDFEI